jgi:hypothetical protein
MRDRGYYRHHKERIRDKWAKIGKRWGISDENTRYPEGAHGWVVRTAENMPTCSTCLCHINPRKLGHKTRQELKHELKEKEQRMEIA